MFRIDDFVELIRAPVGDLPTGQIGRINDIDDEKTIDDVQCYWVEFVDANGELLDALNLREDEFRVIPLQNGMPLITGTLMSDHGSYFTFQTNVRPDFMRFSRISKQYPNYYIEESTDTPFHFKHIGHYHSHCTNYLPWPYHVDYPEDDSDYYKILPVAILTEEQEFSIFRNHAMSFFSYYTVALNHHKTHGDYAINFFKSSEQTLREFYTFLDFQFHKQRKGVIYFLNKVEATIFDSNLLVSLTEDNVHCCNAVKKWLEEKRSELREKLGEHYPPNDGRSEKTTNSNHAEYVSSSNLLKWNGNKSSLADIFKQMKINGLLDNSQEEIALFLKSNFDCYSDTKLSTIITTVKGLNHTKRPHKNNRTDINLNESE